MIVPFSFSSCEDVVKIGTDVGKFGTDVVKFGTGLVLMWYFYNDIILSSKNISAS